MFTLSFEIMIILDWTSPLKALKLAFIGFLLQTLQTLTTCIDLIIPLPVEVPHKYFHFI